MNEPKKIDDLLGRPLSELTEYLAASDYRLRADAASVIGDMVMDMAEKSLPPATLDALHKNLKDPEPRVRLEAAIALSHLNDMSIAPVLYDLAERRQTRLDAVHTLGRIKDRQAIPLLRNMLLKFLVPWAEKLQAAAALCLMDDEYGQKYLESRLTARRYLEKAAACHFIGESHHPQAFEILSKIAIDHTSPLRDTAIRSLGFLNDVRAENLLCELYGNLPLLLQNDVQTALEKMGKVRNLSESAKKILTTSGN